MSFYYALRSVAAVCGYIRAIFQDLGDDIRNVFIIGDWLTPWFYSIADNFIDLRDVFNNAANDFLSFYNYVISKLSAGGDLGGLTQYVSLLVSFAADPVGFIRERLRLYFTALYDFYRDPISYILETIYRYTGLSYDFVHNPRGVIDGIIRSIVGGVMEIAANPRGWLLARLGEIIPAFGLFLANPAAWVRGRIEDASPDMRDFLRDPSGFIVDKMILHLERLLSVYADRLRDLATKILEFVW